MERKKLLRNGVLLFAGLCVLTVAGVLLNFAYEHRGFFEYQYDQIRSPEHKSSQSELIALTRQDPKRAFVRFREILRDDPYSYNACHGVAHQMGHAAFEEFGFQGAMATQDALCGGGYIHGIIEGRFGLLQEKEILKELPTLCEPGAESCYHGIGHGLMIALGLDTDKSLSYCDVLPAEWRRNCFDGVWMHIFDLEESGAHETNDALVPPEPAEIARAVSRCATTGDAYKTSCYFYLPRIFAHFKELSFVNFHELCEGVEEGYRSACAAGVGHAVMKYHIAEPQVSLDRCRGFGSSALVQACKEGAALYFLFSTEGATDATCDAFPGESDRILCRRVNGYRESL